MSEQTPATNDASELSNSQIIDIIKQQSFHTTLLDGIKLRARLRSLKKIKDEKRLTKTLEKISIDCSKALNRYEQRVANVPNVSYPAQLPVSQLQSKIADAIRDNQVVIVAGETGSGKTTQLPKICLEVGRGLKGMIGHTQPRRLAARSVAERIADEMNCELGDAVGFRVRFADKLNDHSYIKLMTDGILLAEIAHDPFLNRYDTIIIDEAHERSLNIDFLFGYLKRILPKRPDLKVVITSATIDTERFSKHFDDAPVIEVSGRTYPVEVRYHIDDGDEDKDQLQSIFDAVDELMAEGDGDILIFMNGEREIRDTSDALSKQKLPNTDILPLYARLSYSEQSKIFKSSHKRRIVLATNVAETSLTVPGIRYVIDPGTARISRYSYRTKVQRLPIEKISQASANQRKGRCGRVADGICIRLYSESDFDARSPFTDPEILRTNLASVILQMVSLGLGHIEAFPFLQAPDSRNINDGIRLLEEIGALSKEHDKKKQYGHEQLSLSAIGKQISKLPIDPRLARMVIEAQKNGALSQLLVIAAGLSIQDPRERPLEQQQKSDSAHQKHLDKASDFIGFLNLWTYLKEQQAALSNSRFRKLCREQFLNYNRVREWQDLVSQLMQVLNEQGIEVLDNESSFDAIHQSILSGLLSHIGFKDQDNEFSGARNSKFYIFPGSALSKKPPKWVMVSELVETSRLFGRVAAKIEPAWIEPLAGDLVKKSYSEAHFEKKRGQVVAFEQVSLFGVVIVAKRKVDYSPINSAESRELFIRQGLVEGQLNSNIPFYRHNLNLVSQVEDLEHKSRRRDILVDDNDLYLFYEEALPKHIVNEVQLNSWWRKEGKKQPKALEFDVEQLIRSDAGGVSKHDFPDTWQQGNLTFRVSYNFEPGEIDDGVSIHIPIELLNQVQVVDFDWQVNGLRHEKVIALIKSLPKAIRRNFVPAPNYADSCMAAMPVMESSLIEAMSKQLLRMSGVRIDKEAWDLNQLPVHLLMNFKVEQVLKGSKNKLLGQGRDLAKLQEDLSDKVAKSLVKVADDGIEKKNITAWDFGELPSSYTSKRGQFEVKAYPALVANKDDVEIKLFDSEEQASRVNRVGLRKLLLINVPSPIAHMQRTLPNKAKLGLYYHGFGQLNVLIDDIISAAVDVIIEDSELSVNNEQQFTLLKDRVRSDLADTVVRIAQSVEQCLSLFNQVNKKLKGKVGLDMIMAHGDIKSQLEGLIFKGFVTELGFERMVHLQRYLQAILKRLEKLVIDVNKDRLAMLSVERVTKDYQVLVNKLPKRASMPPELIHIRWMLEELRVSLFAQTLGTQYPISEKRVSQAITEYKKQG
ncbi:ATP-dependent RNA helicase HrpA [Psychrobium sp. MM17-31]|uniref:ATP-dependent RNA helicase HrpA n=1 Tax=Psychrobium sp. MM17-31 TaxID=2917758 RepID=UPI001EF5245B|nr:ATP-dependent RNA helicase HrpA [Psychrobium sp. MM17-31]MCG7529772.1 ATP-dependent RNA helicase HrpA [Psychrobium sp. MM17-31]